MHEPISFNALPWALKVFAAIIGALLALVLSGDIDTQGRIKITLGVVMKFSFSLSISLYGGSAVIEYYQLGDFSHMAQGFVMLMMAVFGMLIIGIIYQAMQMLRGKTFVQIIQEVRLAFGAIFKE